MAEAVAAGEAEDGSFGGEEAAASSSSAVLSPQPLLLLLLLLLQMLLLLVACVPVVFVPALPPLRREASLFFSGVFLLVGRNAGLLRSATAGK